MLKKTLKTKKAFLPVLLLAVLAGFLVAPAALAVTVGLEYGTYTGLGTSDLRVGVMRLVQYVLGFLGILAVIIILYGGFVWLTSAGNEEKISTAKKILINAIIGLAIILLSFMIASFIINQLIIATGAGQPGQVCLPNECAGCYSRCNATGSGNVYDPDCGGPICYLPPPPPNCFKPSTPTPTICAIKTPQPPGFGGLAQGKVGDYVTIEGWYFGDYEAGTSKVNLDATEMPIVACEGSPLWYERASDNYGLVRVKVPAVATIPETYDLVLTNKSSVSSAASPFKVIDGTAGPQLACIVPPAAGNSITLNKAEGENFGTTQGQLIFNINQSANFARWAETIITAPVVPEAAISGNVKVKDASGDESNNVYFTVTCQEQADCASQCCLEFSCEPASACLPGVGQDCLVNAGEICADDGRCQPGLICDDTLCKCRLPGAGENCDAVEDEVDEGACSLGQCADDLLCSAADACSCQPAPYISAVSPDNGAIGNFITIAGKQFGDNVGWVYFVAEDGAEIEVDLADEANGNCDRIWTDNQIIIAVSDLNNEDRIKVDSAYAIKVKSSGGKSDLTSDGRGPRIPDFTVNRIIRPGLCKIAPQEGQPNTSVILNGINFITTSQVFFAQVLAGGRPIFSSDFQTITGLTVPVLDPATVGVRVLNAAEYSNPLNFEVLASALPPDACSKNPNVCEVDSSKCGVGQYCSAACECVDLEPCGGDDPATSICEGAACAAGFYCNESCYCQPALPCDEDSSTPECDVAAEDICPANYTCDPAKNCTCQPQIGRETESAYAWSFITTRQPGACSQDEGICLPDSQRCEIGFVCNPTSCNCDKITTYPCSSDASHLSCRPDQTQCRPTEYCDSQCECAARIKCDGDPATPECTPRQDKCPLGWYCYDESIHAADSNKLSCYCYQGILCDNPAQPVSPANLACHPDNSYCPANYVCDANSNCTCQKSLGALVDSTYAWTFNTFSQQPQVVEMCDRTSACRSEAISSPAPFTKESALKDAFLNSPRPDDGAVPIDAIISARFNKAMIVDLLVDPANPANHPNIVLEKCADSDCGAGSPVNSKITVSDCQYNSQAVHCFTLEPDSFLTKDTWYRVSLAAKNILGENGLSLKTNTGDFYRWMFKTRNSGELSQVACLYLQPSASTLYSYDQRQKYSAWPTAKDFICVDIRPESCNNGYDWSTLDATRAQIVPTADHLAANPPDSYDAGANDHKATVAAHNDTMLDTPPYTQVKAACNFSPPADSRVDGFSNLTIDFSSPRVIDRFPDCGAACLNARIGATFSVAMDLPSLQNAAKLYNCYNDPTAKLADCAVVSTFSALALQPPPEAPNTYIGDVACFDYNGDGKNDYCLLPDNYYRVVIDGTAKSGDLINPRTLVGLNYDGNIDGLIDSYSWIFRTQKNYGLCLPGQIDVAPAEKWAPKDVEIFYAARPRTKADACDPLNGQRLNPYSWDWVWASTVPTVADLVKPLRDSCGNYVKEAGEDCDDGNLVSGDGCSEICLNEGLTGLKDNMPGNVLLLHMNEDKATDGAIIKDTSGRGNVCVLHTSDSQNKSQTDSRQAILFDGDDYITCPIAGAGKSLQITGNITIEAWVYPDSSAWPDSLPSWNQPSPLVVGKLIGAYLFQFSRLREREIAFIALPEVNNNWADTATLKVELDKWTHLAATYDGATLRYYFNGKPAAFYPKEGKLQTWTAHPLVIGANGFKGAIDEVAIYNRALSAQEIADHYAGCGNGKVDSGEECDPPDSAAYCSDNCLWLGNSNTENVCGNGIVEAGEECDPPKAGCAANCLLAGSVKDQSLCGDGKIGLGEECDTNELATGDLPASNDGCSAKCLVENRSQSYCRSNINNIFDFSKAVCTAGSCGEGYNCAQLSAITGNTNKFSTCANGLIEKGEECDNGGYCADGSWNAILAANGYPTYCNTYGSFCGAGETCRAFEGYCKNQNSATLTSRPCNTGSQCASGICWRDGCGKECIRNGSVYEQIDPPLVGPYQTVKTIADGETDIKANIGYVPPEGSGHLTVGAPPGKFGIIDYWPNCNWACLNAAVGGQFNQSAYVYVVGGKPENSIRYNVFLYGCGADGNCDISGRSSITNSNHVIVSKTAFNNDTFQINLPANYNPIDNDNNPLTPLIPALIPNTYYRVVVRNRVLTADGKQNLDANLNYNDPKFTPAGGDISTVDSFSWVFKTQPQDDLCSLDKVEIIPTPLTLPEGNIRYIYFAQPWVLPDPYCSPNRGQKLNAYHYNWRWDDWETITNQNGADFLTDDNGVINSGILDDSEVASGDSLKDGCGNGIREAGEDCDPGFQSGPGCNSNCFWLGTAAPACGNGQIDAGEECEPPGRNYCGADCLLTGNNNYNLSVCGNGIVEAGEACDSGHEPNNNESDGCTDICAKSGAVPAADSICGDGQITKGEECDQGELAKGQAPVSGDGCSGNNPPVCGAFLDKNSCEQVDFSNLLNNHIRACYWTGNTCQVRPCLLETSSLMGNNNYGQPVCGNGLIEIGEECDDGNITNGYCSADGAVCSSIGSACAGGGECLADGCGPTCLNNGSVAHDNRLDPFQIIETEDKLPAALSSVKEEIRAWYVLSPERVGVGELYVVSGAEVPFAVIGHQPGVNAINQCPNAALWAVFSKPLDLAAVENNFILCQNNSGCAGRENLISEYTYRPIQGICAAETNKCDYGDLAESIDFGELCQSDADCLASQILVTKLNTQTGFLEKDKDYYFDVAGIKSAKGYCSGGRQVCQSDADCGGAADSCLKGLESPVAGREDKWTFKTGMIFCECSYVGVRIDYTSGGAETVNDLFSCAGDNCGVNTAKKQDDDVSPLKLCRGGDKPNQPCSVNDDCGIGGQCVFGLPGNQHRYTAQCWDVANFSERQPIGDAGISFSWIDIDPDHLIFLTNICSAGTNDGLVCEVDADCPPSSECAKDNYNDRVYVTPGDDDKPAAKNGRSQVKAGASQYRLGGKGEFCAIGSSADCKTAPAASQYVSVINFICENPWPEFAAFPYRDNESNLKAPDTNFEMYYCRDFGQATTTDDLPALAAGPVLDPAGPVLKEFIFPVGELAKTEAGGLLVAGKDLDMNCNPNPAVCGKIVGEAKSCCTSANNDWRHTFTGLAAGNYVVSVTSFNNFQNLSGVSFCDSDGDSVLETGEFTACEPTDNAACANQPEKCLTGIAHVIEVYVDAESRPRGKIVNFAAGATEPQTGQTGQLAIGNLTDGDRMIKLKWLNDYFNNTVNPSLDSNLAILSLGLDLVAGSSGASGDALGIRVLPNPLHLSPQTWYKSGLCGGLASIDNLCYRDADCALNNLFKNGDFEAGLSPWEFQAAAGASGSLIETNSGQNGKGAKLTLAGLGGWGGQLRNADNPSELIILPAGNYAISASVKSNKKVYLGVENKSDFSKTISCQNANCDSGSKVCGRQTGDWERLTCNFSLAESTNMQFIVRLKDEAGEADIDNLLLTSACKKNVPDAGSGQAIVVDGYQAIRDGRSVYVGATNRVLGAPATLYSDIYLISYNQDAASQTKEIFNRILDQAGQKGKWYFNADFTNNRICQGDIGYYEDTDVVCREIGQANNDICEAKASNDCKNDAGAAAGCYWSAEKNGCLAHPCFPIYCWNNFDCPNLECDASKEKVVRDSERFGDLRDIQLLLRTFGAKNRGLFPALGSGTYIAPLTFSVWPSWQETLGKDLGGNLYLDPLNRFKGCVDYACDSNKNGKIDGGENDAGCNFGDITGCNNQPKLCVAKDPDQEKTCWQEIEKQFVCPVEMAVYAYQSANRANDYELYTNFEYGDSGHWGLATNFYALPLSGLAGGETCERLNFKASKNTITAPSVTLDCSTLGGDMDFDGICDDADNCKPYPHSPYHCKNSKDCYNPDQRDSGGVPGLGDVCDTACGGDKDGDRVCDDIDNCPNVSNPKNQVCLYNHTNRTGDSQCDADLDNYGDACDPCTDLDGDGWWDVDTGANDAKICLKDNCPKFAGWRASAPETPISLDRRKYCSNSRLKTCDDSGDCGGGSCDDKGSYNPLQEDYDNDGLGYICDFCLDFDGDNKGDYSFYTKKAGFASSLTPAEGGAGPGLTDNQKQHFKDCQFAAGAGDYSGFVFPDPSFNYSGSDNSVLDFGDVSDFAAWMKKKTTDMSGSVCQIPAGCDINKDGDINFEDVSAYADLIIGKNKLDNCAGGSFGFKCRDQFGIKVSCANLPAPNWKDVYWEKDGDYLHKNSQRDINLNGVGDLCDPWGNGKLDGICCDGNLCFSDADCRGCECVFEECDCGAAGDESDNANDFCGDLGNGEVCTPDLNQCASPCLWCAVEVDDAGRITHKIRQQSSATYGDGEINRKICPEEKCDCGSADNDNFVWRNGLPLGGFQSDIFSADGVLIDPYVQTCTTMNGAVCGGPGYSLACCFWCGSDSQPTVGPAGGCCGDGIVQPAAGEECDLKPGILFDENGNMEYANGQTGPDDKIIKCTEDCKCAPGYVCDDGHGNPIDPVACDCRADETWLDGWSCPAIECDGRLLVDDVSCDTQESCTAVPAPAVCHEGGGCGLVNDLNPPLCTKPHCPNTAVPRPCVDKGNNGCCNIPPQEGETCEPAGKYDWGCPLTENCGFTLMTEPVDHLGRFLKFDGNRLFASGKTANGAEVFTANKTMIDDPTCDTEAFNIKDSAGVTLGAQRAGLRGWVGKDFINQDFCFTHVANDPQSVFSVGDVINVVWDADANVNRTYWSTRWGEGVLGQPPDPIGMVTLNAQSWEQYRICQPSGWCGPCKTEKDCDASAGEICCGGVCKKLACAAATQDVDCFDGIDCSIDACVLGASACDNACKDPRDIISTCAAGDKCCPLNGVGQPLCTAAQDPECACGECDGACPPICNSSNDPDCGCAGKNGCCGQGCNYSADIDCPIRIGDTITIRNVGFTEPVCTFQRQAFSSFLVDDGGQVRVTENLDPVSAAASAQRFKFVVPNEIVGITPVCGDAPPAKEQDQKITNNLCVSVQPADDASSYYGNEGNDLKKNADYVRNYSIKIPSPKKLGEFHVDDIFNMQLKNDEAGDGNWWSTKWCPLQPSSPKVIDTKNDGNVNDPVSWERFQICANDGTCEEVACELPFPHSCDNSCDKNCLYSQDPDCGCGGVGNGCCNVTMGCTPDNDCDCSNGGTDCRSGNGCCGIGCNNTNDTDCPITVCVPNGCNGNCPPACTGTADSDCDCASHNGCCGGGCGFETDADCPIIVGSAVTFMTAEHTGNNTDFNTNPAVNGTLVKTAGNSMEVARDPAAGYLTQFVINPADTANCFTDCARYPSNGDTLKHGDCIQLSIRGVGDVPLGAEGSLLNPDRIIINGAVDRQCYEVLKEAGSGDVIPGDVIKLHAKGTAYDKYCPLGICVWDSTNFWLIINWNDNGVIKNGNANTGSAWINNWERFYILNQNKEGTVDRNYYNRL